MARIQKYLEKGEDDTMLCKMCHEAVQPDWYSVRSHYLTEHKPRDYDEAVCQSCRRVHPNTLAARIHAMKYKKGRFFTPAYVECHGCGVAVDPEEFACQAHKCPLVGRTVHRTFHIDTEAPLWGKSETTVHLQQCPLCPYSSLLPGPLKHHVTTSHSDALQDPKLFLLDFRGEVRTARPCK
eukprot:Sspe_Gene.103087::Locus_78913_Transcript_1_1_Confidence_1.000_Length_606::g.103087::m.103087